ncbi:MAG TPA: hypothetical protein PLE28_00665 [bacterium]|nr:hypothetical protein [bacterium]
MFDFNYILKNKRKIAVITAIIFLVEATSFLSYYYPNLNIIIFFILALSAIVLSIYKLEWGLYMVTAELFFDSMGYIFFWDNGGIKISIRIILWLIIMSVWLAKFLLTWFKEKSGLIKKYLNIPFLKSFSLLSFFVILAVIFGIIKNGFSDAFFDFNAWLFFTLIFPVWHIMAVNKDDQIKNFWSNIVNIFLAAIIFLVFKSLLVLFLFSHNIPGVIYDFYYWTRTYSLGEITNMGDGFYRVFFQSQIFIVLAFILFSIQIIKTKSRKEKIYLLIFLSFLASALILSFSRSFWVGAVCSILFLGLIILIKFGFKTTIKYISTILLSLIIGFLIMFVSIKFPWPNSQAQFNLNSLSSRANIISNESAISSRWALLKIIKGDLKNNFLIGRGFGARLEYQSSDPRVLEQSADGLYSTYAFEWGWFDIWLKLGLLGVLAYIYLLITILKEAWFNFKNNKNLLSLGILSAIICLIAINFFTPYLNHPLGIGFLLLSSLFLSNRLCSKY